MTVRRRWLGIGAVALGALLLATAGGFFGYVGYARDRIGDVSAGDPVAPSSGEGLAAAIEPTAAGHPGASVPPQFWDEPFWAEPVRDAEIAAGFQPVEGVALPASGLGKPTRVRIPAIGLDSETMGLAIQDLGDARQYETPPFVVGHIPESADPGEVGNAWFFGHLESPIRGEGSVFRELPSVFDLLRQGRQVYVIVDSGDGSFLYRVTEFQKMPREELYLWGSSGRTVSLVTCWPRFVYDERIVVTAELVGVALVEG